MATLNNYTVIPRHNRPGVTTPTYLEFFFVKNGILEDPYEVCSVHVFSDVNNGDSAVWIDDDTESETHGLVPSSLDSSAAAIFLVEGGGNPLNNSTGFSSSNYENTATTASGIYKIGEGHFAVALRNASNFKNRDEDTVRTTSASSTGRYFDIWTVVGTQGASPDIYVHSFELFRDTALSLTEPLLLTTRHSLVQRYVNKNSKIKLQIKSAHTVNNKNLSEETKSIFTQSIISNAGIRIIRLKDDRTTGEPYSQVLPWTNDVQIDSEDTITYNWDTADLPVGTYELQTSSNVLDQKIFSDKFNLVVR